MERGTFYLKGNKLWVIDNEMYTIVIGKSQEGSLRKVGDRKGCAEEPKFLGQMLRCLIF
jgi:hypothetical protein